MGDVEEPERASHPQTKRIIKRPRVKGFGSSFGSPKNTAEQQKQTTQTQLPEKGSIKRPSIKRPSVQRPGIQRPGFRSSSKTNKHSPINDVEEPERTSPPQAEKHI